MKDFLHRGPLRNLVLSAFTLVLGFTAPETMAQDQSEEQVLAVLDSLQDQLYTFNYFDSLNNRPLFFSFPFDVRKISLQAEKAGFETAYYEAEHLRARYYSYNDVVNKVFEIYDSAANRARKRGDLKRQAHFIYWKGRENRRNDWYDVALDYYSKAFSLADSAKDISLKGEVIHSMAACYAAIRQDETAISYYRMALDIARTTNNTRRQIGVMSSLGIAYGRMGYADSALFYGEQVYELSAQEDYLTGTRRALNSLIIGHQLKGDHEMVLKLTDEMVEVTSPTGEVGYMITPLLSRSKSYFAQGNMQAALNDVNLSLKYSRKVGFPNGEFNAMRWKIELLKNMGRLDSALNLSAELHAKKDSIYFIETEERLTSVTKNFEIRERESRIEGLVQVNEINSRRLLYRNLAIVAIVMVFLVLIILLLLINRRKLEQEKYALQETQDKLLRSQLNPHFLFNALSSIQLFLINKGQGKEALEYLSKFAKLMRRILENSRESMVSLEDEIATLRHYLDLQKIRFDNSFDYNISVETEKDMADIMIPPMFAQPFIENSLEHGISNRENGMIQIWFRETDEGLNFRVEDNGIGISRSMRTNRPEEHKSLATVITRDRINILRRQLKQRISFDIRDKVNEQEEITGTEVIFDLPVVYR